MERQSADRMIRFLMESGLYVAAGALMGFIGGWLFYRLWRGLLPRSRSGKFWRSLPDSVRGMLTSDEPSDLFRCYRALVVATARYAGRNTLAVLVGIMPVAVIFLLLDALDLSSHVAARVEVQSDWRMDNGRLFIDRGKLGDSLDREALTKKQVFCETTVSCLLFDMFETDSIALEAERQIGGSVVVRPVLLDSNLFWPYLNDLDFWFFIGVMSGSAAAAWRSRHRRVEESLNFRTADFWLTRFAHSSRRALKLLGDLETDLLRSRLDEIKLDRPVFITGLARSGTTILLNVFSSLPNVGTHRYRDFPFLFVPYSWNQFQDRMARTQEPVERPHRDRIRITKDSPEAFEEPIWMHFFPFVHCPYIRHVLTAANDDPQFDAFYLEHLRKVLLLRRRERYVSKGNYNIARLEYIAHLLPDARFVIPIRHPLSHVSSLVRQHRLFTRYSEEDGRVPEYMRATGHYEFGPQRVPINLDAESSPHILQAWAEGQDALGYAVMWRSVYAHVRRFALDGALGERIRIVRYEDFCADPAAVLGVLFEFCALTEGVDELLGALPEIRAPESDLDCLPEVHRNQVWRETAELAESFGYDRGI